MRRRRAEGPISANRDGSFSINLSADERATLVGFIEQLRPIVEGSADDPRTQRLYPTAYHSDAEKDAEYQEYMRDELQQSRITSIEAAIATLRDDQPLSEAQLMGFMTVLNALRLVLGTLLDVGEDADETDISEDDPTFGQYQLYGYLGWLLEWVVSALTGD